jgi:hypothetical protein
MPARLATHAEVVILAPELVGSAVDPEPLDTIIEFTGEMISIEEWGEKASKGHALLAAHFASLWILSPGGGGAPAGAVTSRTLDKLSVSYASGVAKSGNPAFALTKYGQFYLAMFDTLMIPPLGTGGPWP